LASITLQSYKAPLAFVCCFVDFSFLFFFFILFFFLLNSFVYSFHSIFFYFFILNKKSSHFFSLESRVNVTAISPL
jgi:hypothetical protein